MAQIEEHQADLGGHSIAWRQAPHAGDPVLYVHGVPDSGELWDPLLARTGGFAVDLPGFGRSAKPSAGPYSIGGMADALEAFVGLAGIGRFKLVVHDWGVVGLALAQRMPERVARLVIVDAVPLLPGYRWHLMARVWRTPLAGELAMGFTFAWNLRRVTGLSKEQVRRVMRHFDHGTQRAILKLYRSADPEALAAAGAGLGDVTAPALVLWGERDPFLAPSLAHAFAAALGSPDPEVAIVPGAGHWVWLDEPAVADRIVSFLE